MTQSILQQESEAAVPFVMELYARKARLQLVGAQELLSSGMSGVIQTSFTFSEDWAGLKKTAVFSNGVVSIDVPEEKWEGSVCTIPQQVLSASGKTLMVGMFGTDGEDVALPTVWCSLGRVEPGAALSGIDTAPPEAPIWARLEKRLGQMEGISPRLVRVLSMTSCEDGSATVLPDHTFEQIESACREGQPVVMEISGTVLLLTRLNAGVSAEFTGTTFLMEGIPCCYHCLVPQSGSAVLTVLPVAGVPQAGVAEMFLVSFRHGAEGYCSDQTNEEIYDAVQAGKLVIGMDVLGRTMQLNRWSQSFAWFSALSYDHDAELFTVQLYRLEGNAVTVDAAYIMNQDKLVQSVIAALPVYGGEVAE